MSRDPESPDAELPDGEESELGPEQRDRLVHALRAAWRPAPLAADRQRALLEQALSAVAEAGAEAAGAERLRAALDQDSDHPDATLARALRAAVAPEALEPARAEQILTQALSASGAPPQARQRKSGNLVYVVFGAGSAALALAAAAVLLVRGAMPAAQLEPRASHQALAMSRSTAPLFTEKFSAADSSERVERITLVRERELRNNRFARWGVR
jgi:hypothetical protein